MTSLELYYEFTLLLNKNSTADNINIDVPNFVWLYNREANRWLSDRIRTSSLNSDSQDLEPLLIVNQNVSLIKKEVSYNTYNLPINFFDFVDSYCEGEKDGCIRNISNFLVKPKELRTIVDNSFTNPSFEYEESICNITDKKLLIYKKDYEIKNAYLSYYKTVPQIDIEGYLNSQDQWSTTIDSDLPDFLHSQVLDRIVTEVMRQFENPNGYKLSMERQTQK